MTDPLLPAEGADDTTARVTAETGGDPGRGRQVRRALERLRGADDPRLRQLAEDVLSGRREVRSVLQDDAFDAVLTQRMPQFFEQLEAMDPAERDALVAQGREQRMRDLAAED